MSVTLNNLLPSDFPGRETFEAVASSDPA